VITGGERLLLVFNIMKPFGPFGEMDSGEV